LVEIDVQTPAVRYLHVHHGEVKKGRQKKMKDI
jgi:hypothetical protein